MSAAAQANGWVGYDLASKEPVDPLATLAATLTTARAYAALLEDKGVARDLLAFADAVERNGELTLLRSRFNTAYRLVAPAKADTDAAKCAVDLPPDADDSEAEAAMAALQAAKLRKALAEDGVGSIFVHAPRSGTPLPAQPNRTVYGTTNAAQVSRDSGATYARLSLNGGVVLGTPGQLRNLAERLIDAAHDIETNPASSPKAQQSGGAA